MSGSRSMSLPPSGSQPKASPLGNFYGTGIVGVVEFFLKKYGPAAGHAVIARLSPEARKYVTPNAAFLGVLGARKYPYAFVGELLRAMMAVTKTTDEEAFLREIVGAGMDLTLSTVGRAILRYAVTPHALADRAGELWAMFHDAGRLTIISRGEKEYVVDMTEWPNHDATVCQMCVAARRRIVEKTGVTGVDVRRMKCVAWGHTTCEFRVRWA